MGWCWNCWHIIGIQDVCSFGIEKLVLSNNFHPEVVSGWGHQFILTVLPFSSFLPSKWKKKWVWYARLLVSSIMLYITIATPYDWLIFDLHRHVVCVVCAMCAIAQIQSRNNVDNVLFGHVSVYINVVDRYCNRK